jgi:hypothetical protein
MRGTWPEQVNAMIEGFLCHYVGGWRSRNMAEQETVVQQAYVPAGAQT